MSDGFHDDMLCGASEPYPTTRFDDRTSAHVASTPLDWYRFATWLPRLGAVLWLHRAGDGVFPHARLLSRGVLLLDHPALAAFSGSAQVKAHSVVTARGPREWLELIDVESCCLARLYLLPDSDYLAWDAMLADCAITHAGASAATRWRAHAAFLHCALRGRRQCWQARTVRFPLLHLPRLHVLGLCAPLALSDLGQQLAQRIAEDERAELHFACP